MNESPAEPMDSLWLGVRLFTMASNGMVAELRKTGVPIALATDCNPCRMTVKSGEMVHRSG